jgi:putative inorganic carbon (HCO3(-)) transporter
MSDAGRRLRPASVLFSLLLLSPLVWIPGTGFDGPRLPVVLGLLGVLLGYGALAGTAGGRSKLLWAALALFGVHLLSLLVARTPGEAATPLLVLFAGVSVFGVARSGLVAREFVLEGVPVLLSIVGLAVSAVGVVQRVYGQPVVTTEGNTNYSGAFAGMLLPVLAAFSAAGRRRHLCLLAAAALLVLLLLSRSRGGWVGAIGGMSVGIGGLAWRRVPGARLAAGAGLILLVLPLVFQGGDQLSEARAPAVVVRLELWKGAARMLASHPLLGVGAGNFSVEYPPFRSEAEFRASHQYVDSGFVEAEDAHSSWVQVAAEAGLPGLVSLLLVVGLGARLWLRRMKAGAEPETLALLAGLGAGAAAFLVAGLFNTLTLHVSHTLFFWAFLGLIDLFGDANPTGEAAHWPWTAQVTAVVVALVATGYSGMLVSSDRDFNAGMSTLDLPRRVAHLERAAKGHPSPWKARYYIERAQAAMGRPDQAAAAGREAVRLRPHHVMALNNTGASVLRTKDGEAEAERLFRHAVEVAPYYYLSHFNLGSLLLQRKQVAAAREQFQIAARCNSKHASSVFSLGETWAIDGDAAAALAEFRRADAIGFNSGMVLREEHPDLARDPRYAELFK